MKESYYISLYDFREQLFKEKKRLFVLFSLFFGLFFYLGLIQPVKFTATAVLKIPTSSKSTIKINAADSLNDPISEERPLDFLDSFAVLSKVVTQLNLQGHLYSTNSPLYKTIGHNLMVEWKYLQSLFKRNPSTSFPTQGIWMEDEVVDTSPNVSFHIKKLSYEKEIFSLLTLEFLDEERFIVRNKNEYWGEGTLNLPFYFEGGFFQLEKLTHKKTPKKLKLSLIPLKAAVEGLSKNLIIKKNGKKLSQLSLSYISSNSQLPSLIVNEVVSSFQEFLKENAHQNIQKQQNYFAKRKEETTLELKALMKNQQATLASHIEKGGFLNVDNESSFYAVQHKDLLHKLNELQSKIEKLIFFENHKINEKEASFLTVAHGEEQLSNNLKKIIDCEVEKKHLQLCHEKLFNDLPKSLQIPSIQPLIQEISLLSHRLIDEKNWSSKEREIIKEEILVKKNQLNQELLSLIEAKDVELNQLRESRDKTSAILLFLLKEEFAKTRSALTKLASKESNFSDTLFNEKEIEINKELCVLNLQNLSKAIELKNASLQMAAINTYALERAIKPPWPNPPLLLLKPLLMGFLAILAYIFCLMTFLFVQGPKATFHNLKGLGKIVLSSIKDLSYFLCTHCEKGKVVLLTSKTSAHILPLFELLSVRKEKILTLEMSLSGTSLDNCLSSITSLKYSDHIKLCKKINGFEELLMSSRFTLLIDELKGRYDWIFMQHHADPLSHETEILHNISDQVIYAVTDEKLEEIVHLSKAAFHFQEAVINRKTLQETKQLLSRFFSRVSNLS